MTEGNPLDTAEGGTSEINATCPACGYVFDHATGVGEDAIEPEEGAWNVCIRCAGIGVWDAGADGVLTVRAIKKGERIPDDVREVALGLAKFRETHPHRTQRRGFNSW